ncbi:hypothetical protein EOL72_02600 [Candidatus Falkowbacteria bacterium]|jgi:hypothetical protein|nr:hypothetical protein [Candidatus Falkowbacteria bacterium]
MKKLGGILSTLFLLLLFFYLAVFSTLGYNSDNFSAQSSDRWPLVGQFLAGVSTLVDQANNRPLPLFAWGARGLSFQMGEFIKNQSTQNNDIVSLPLYKNQGTDLSGANYLKEAFRAGAFDLGVVWTKLISRLKEFR